MAVSESRIREIGEDLFARMRDETPGVFDKAWWSGQVLDRAMRDEAFKTEMFRFVDVFPVLRSTEEIARHIQEYLLRPGLHVPAVIKMALKGAGIGGVATRLATGQIAKNLENMARRFIAGTDGTDAAVALGALRREGMAFTVDLLGEATVSEAEADDYAARYEALLDHLVHTASDWPEDQHIERDDRGPLPRVNVSVKVSAMYSQLDELAVDDSVEAAAQRLLPLFRKARDKGVFLNLDMESYAHKDLTLALFRRVLEDPSLADYDHAGVVIQAYLRDAEPDLRDLIKWAKKKKKRITVRLVKGAYWDYETVKAEQEGWASPVWLDKADTDACFEACAELLLSNHKHVRTAIGSHNLRSISHAVATAERHKVPLEGYEVQCLYGMAEPIRRACRGRGHRVRVYAPIGELIPGMAYLVRRLLENTSNESWLRQGFAENADRGTLLASPRGSGRSAEMRPVPKPRSLASDPGLFYNEPPRDFSRAPVRDAFGAAVAHFERELGQTWTPIVDGEALSRDRRLTSVDPADGETVIGEIHLATIDDADRAVDVARKAFPTWRDRSPADRAQIVLDIAAGLRLERDALAALMVREVGKPWREADGDVCEAIDFCEYYAREALELAHLGRPRRMQDIPGETNHLFYIPRGVAAVIAPWNFPLAILTGMTTAALVTGNTVIVKPAEQSPVIAARFARIAYRAGVPAGVLQFLPGLGEDVGAALVRHPDVATIAFTGSMEVGLDILAVTGRTDPRQALVKRVICEMGGKNALIVDSDADLDEAVQGTVQSAFGFAGQKCSACSRVIVLADNYDAFLSRLIEATQSLVIGAPSHPSTRVGPVIDAEAHTRILDRIRNGEGRRVTEIAAPERGWFVPPTVFADVAPESRLAQEEIFGPVLAVIRAEDFEHALTIANGTRYALTGGLYSRSPSRIARAREAFNVGNLYINRTITGAIVGRQPFGGFRMSGAGTKAGGPDYLRQFCDARTITENTLRRGFAPQEG